MRIRIVEAHTPDAVPLVSILLREYAAWLGIDLSFQGFEAELATLPGKYLPPAGALLLAYADDAPAGCIALRPLDASCCEIKRLWVRGPFRAVGLGGRLVRDILERARRSGYAIARLDTLAHMSAAQALYRKLGFHEIPAYYPNPLPDTVYLEKRLVD